MLLPSSLAASEHVDEISGLKSDLSKVEAALCKSESNVTALKAEIVQKEAAQEDTKGRENLMPVRLKRLLLEVCPRFDKYGNNRTEFHILYVMGIPHPLTRK